MLVLVISIPAGGGYCARGLRSELSKCKELLSFWDGENEEISDVIDKKLSNII